MSTSTPKIVLIGCGKMGSAMLQSWLETNIDADFAIIDPQKPPFNVPHLENPADIQTVLPTADIIVMALKPQIMADTCKTLAPLIKTKSTILSIAAGQSLANFADYFGAEQPVIRVMPNTPAAIGKGVSAYYPNEHVPSQHLNLALTLLETTGTVIKLDKEELFDAVTALSGSGPAYLFYIIEALTKAGTEIGLPPEVSEQLARQTVIGSSALAENEANTPASTLRENVTSPGGTTQAALEVIMNGDMQKIWNTALQAACDRSKELG